VRILLAAGSATWSEQFESYKEWLVATLASIPLPRVISNTLWWASLSRPIAEPDANSIRCIAWHPLQDRLALALNNDQVCVFYPEANSGMCELLHDDDDDDGSFVALTRKVATESSFNTHDDAPSITLLTQDSTTTTNGGGSSASSSSSSSSSANNLRYVHQFQTDIRCLSWKPFCGTVLAVGCKYGVCLWIGATEKGQPWMSYLPHPNGPVTTLAWSPCGLYVAATHGTWSLYTANAY
jgi:WD40 repeat protein